MMAAKGRAKELAEKLRIVRSDGTCHLIEKAFQAAVDDALEAAIEVAKNYSNPLVLDIIREIRALKAAGSRAGD